MLDGPSISVDELLETLGAAPSLPPFPKSRRTVIEAGLKPLN